MKKLYAENTANYSLSRIKEFLERHEIEHFIPFHEVVLERDGKRVKVEKPVVPNYVFIHSVPEVCRTLFSEYFLPMSFLRCRESNDLLVVPDKQMDDFILLNSLPDDSFFLMPADLKHGDKVRVIRGQFAGIEGELIRIKGHKRVVVRLEGLFSLAVTTYIPRENIVKIDG